MKTAVLTVFYPGMESFLDAYIEAINGQLDNGFELVIVDDHFPGSMAEVRQRIQVPSHIVVSPSTLQGNRMNGLKYCLDTGFELIVCNDSDETMHADRVAQVRAYFEHHPEHQLMFNNTVTQLDEGYFDVDYKPVIHLEDLLDFNVLGYGAMNLRAELVPFILNLHNEDVVILDWWIGLLYLLNYNRVDFRSNIKNNYTQHENNFVGPALTVTRKRISQSISTKKNVYSEVYAYCMREDKQYEAGLFKHKLQEIEHIQEYIKRHSMDSYFHAVQQYFSQKEKIFWWQEAVPLNKLALNINAQ